MKPVMTLLVLIAALALAGCGMKSADSPSSPLSVADWQTMSVDQKYTSEALERLKEGNPKLQTAEGWEEFSRTTLKEAQKRDFPKGKRKP